MSSSKLKAQSSKGNSTIVVFFILFFSCQPSALRLELSAVYAQTQAPEATVPSAEPLVPGPELPLTSDEPVVPDAEPEGSTLEPVVPSVEPEVPSQEPIVPELESLDPGSAPAFSVVVPDSEPSATSAEGAVPGAEPVVPTPEAAAPGVAPPISSPESLAPSGEPTAPLLESSVPNADAPAASPEPPSSDTEPAVSNTEPSIPSGAGGAPNLEPPMPTSESVVSSSVPAVPTAQPSSASPLPPALGLATPQSQPESQIKLGRLSFGFVTSYYAPELSTIDGILSNTQLAIVADPNYLLPGNPAFRVEARNLVVEEMGANPFVGLETQWEFSPTFALRFSGGVWQGEGLASDTIATFLRSNLPQIEVPRSARYNLVLDQFFLDWRYFFLSDPRRGRISLDLGILGVS
ncbi:MAG: hypothetical protein ACREIQ_04125, partial [Nitrospiria bacterium]